MHIPETPADSADIMSCLQKQNSNPQGQWRLWAPKAAALLGSYGKSYLTLFLLGISEVIGLIGYWQHEPEAFRQISLPPSFAPGSARLPQQPRKHTGGNGSQRPGEESIRRCAQRTSKYVTKTHLHHRQNLSQNVFLKLDLVGFVLRSTDPKHLLKGFFSQLLPWGCQRFLPQAV